GFVTETGKRFARAVMPELAEIDVARIVMVTVDGRAVAFSWNLVLERNVFLHRLAFDPAFSRCSPGILNAHNSLELAADEGVVKAEFLGGAESHKLELADGFEPLYLGLGLPGSAKGRAAVAARSGWLRLRRRGRASQLTRRLYYGTASARRHVM